MSKLGVEFSVGESAASAGTAQSTGTMFLVASSNYGPEEATKVRSLSEVEKLYAPSGRETENAKLYDAAQAFFALGGQTAYVNRIHGAGSPKAALKELETATKTKVLVVTAKWKGTYGEKLKIEVTEASSKTKLVILNPAGEVLESSGEYTEAKQLKAWGEEHKTYVEITAGANYASGETELVKKFTVTTLSEGSPANPTNNETTTKESIAGFPKSLGPGQLVCAATEAFKEKVHQAMFEAAQTGNRFALLDIEGSESTTTAATIITNKKPGVTGTTLLGYGAFFSSACTCQGYTVGTTRTIPSSAVVAGLLAKVSATGTDNRAPAGQRYPLSPFVLGFTNTYSEAANNELNEANINVMAEKYGVLCLYGTVSACAKSKDQIFCQYPAGRERMRIQWEGEQVLERFMFVTLDGRHLKRSMLSSQLAGVIKKQWELEGLYGETANEAGQVNVGEPINTPTSEQLGELNAEMQVRISPTVESLHGILISVPITEAVV